MNEYIAIGLGVLIGGYIVYQHFKIKNLERDIFEVADNILTPQQMAKEILSVKLPINDLPPDIEREIKEEMKKMKSNKKGGASIPPLEDSYFG